MADDKLIFPIGFDLNEGVKEALKDGDKAIERLYNALAKKPITVKLKIDSGEALSRSAKTLSGLKKRWPRSTENGMPYLLVIAAVFWVLKLWQGIEP